MVEWSLRSAWSNQYMSIWTDCITHTMCGSANRNRSLSHIEPVCGTPKRKLENGEQRLAPETHRSRTERLEIADQRLGRASLTRRNVGDSHTPGNHTAETGLAGWA